MRCLVISIWQSHLYFVAQFLTGLRRTICNSEEKVTRVISARTTSSQLWSRGLYMSLTFKPSDHTELACLAVFVDNITLFSACVRPFV